MSLRRPTEPGHWPDSRPDPQLDAMFCDVVASIEDDLREDGGCPDLAAVVALAHRIDPDAVPQAAVDEVARWAPVVTLREGRRRRATRDDPELFALLSEVRAHVEQDVVDRFAAPARAPASVSPRMPLASAEPAAGEVVHGSDEAAPAPGEVVPIGARRVWAGVMVAAAALLLVAGGVVTGVLATRDEGRVAPQEAVHQDRPTNAERPTQAHDEVPSRGAPSVAPELQAPEVEPAIEPEPEPEADAEPKTDRSGPRRRGRSQEATAPSAPTLDELDAEAHAAWRRGDLAAAESAFRAIVTRAGRGKLADLAYGDLFTLARQKKAPAREVALWREYLRTFPRGRFADDARAGLCRRAAEGDERRACWDAYLQAMPEGAHRGQARRELEAP